MAVNLDKQAVEEVVEVVVEVMGEVRWPGDAVRRAA
jgi:hypothetical protein